MKDSTVTTQSRPERSPFPFPASVQMLLRRSVFPRVALATIGALVATASAEAHWCNSGARLTNIERAICSDAGLIDKDRQLNALYKSLGGSHNAILKAGQRDWMRARNACESMGCLHSYYDERLRVLVNIRSLRDQPATPPPPPVVTHTPPPATTAPPPQVSSPPPAPSAPSSSTLEKLPDIKPF